jgi:asparagine synthase (glutamine-hydrolysing)
MCGICGVVIGDRSGAVDPAVLRRMTETLRHRGPDDEGHWLAEPTRHVGLGFRRLSIIDLAGGHQPMSNEDGTVWIVFNGEIYNFQDLRPGLEARGHVFRTRCDTEAIIHLYEEKGERVVDDLRGMFAFAIWDDRKQQLLLARDRLGKKPLSYWLKDGTLVFGSELKAILAWPGVPREVDPVALHHYLTYQYVPHPRTMFAGIAKLPPGHTAVFQDGRLTLRRYWAPDYSLQEERPEAEWCERIRHELTEATRIRLMSDVPLGAFLSGGIDSSITVALMSTLSGDPVKTFSIGFEERAFDETSYARLVARRYHTDHHEFIVRPDCLEVLPKLIWYYDEPFADSSAIPTYYVSQMTRQYVTVALSGDAGDECFAGYPRYRAVKLATRFDRLPGAVRGVAGWRVWQRMPASVQQKTWRRRFKKLLLALNQPPEARYLKWISIFDDVAKAALYAPEFARRVEPHPSAEFILAEYAKVPRLDFVGRTTFVDLMTYLPCDILAKVDIASMANSLECRSPFLDHHVVGLAGRIPTRLKLRGMETKYILKKAFADLLPRPILTRPKMGFGVPIAEWFRGELAGFLRETLLSQRALGRGYFLPAEVRRYVDEHISRVFDHGYRLWALLVLELWHQRFIDG